MKRGSTNILRAAIILIGLLILALCIFALPAGISSDEVGYYRPILFGMYISVLPFFYALHQAFKLLGYIDKDRIFSDASVRVLGNIKYCAVAISGLYAAGMPFIYYAANKDDAPGVIVLGLLVIFASFVIATAAAVFQKLLQRAIDIKSENDLTV